MSFSATQPCSMDLVEISFHSLSRQAPKSFEHRILSSLLSMGPFGMDRRTHTVLQSSVLACGGVPHGVASVFPCDAIIKCLIIKLEFCLPRR